VFEAVHYPLGFVPVIGDVICRFKGRTVWEVAADSSMDPTIEFSDVFEGQDDFGA